MWKLTRHGGCLSARLRQPIPLADGCCAAVYHSHVLEHFPRDEAPGFLSECYRLLRTGGILRVVVPDLETIARLYLQNLEGALVGAPGRLIATSG